MNEVLQIVCNDLENLKAWNDVKICFSEKLRVSYLIAQELRDSLKTIVFACYHTNQLSHFELISLFEHLNPPGDMSSYEGGLLLAIVGNSSNIVYHRLLPGIYNILPRKKRQTLT